MVDIKFVEDLLKRINICISNGDYYSAKELALLELDNLHQNQTQKKKRKNLLLKKDPTSLTKEEIIQFIHDYSTYLSYEISSCDSLTKLKTSIIFIDEFFDIKTY